MPSAGGGGGGGAGGQGAAPFLNVFPTITAAGRYSQSSNHRTSQSSNHRHSRASLARGSVLAGGGTRGTTALDSSGIPFERILCIDPEDGRDRTPKPLVAARPHGAAEVAAAWGSSDGPGIYGADASASGSRLSVMSFGGPLLPCSIPSVHSFLGSEAGDASVDGGLDSGRLMSAGRRGRQSTMHHSGAPAGRPAPGTGANEVQQQHQQAVDGNVGKAEPASSGFLELGRGEVPEQQHRQERQRREQLRSKATQCRPVALASRGVQVLPWELRDGAGAEEAEEAAAATHRDGAVGDAGDEDDALLAMMQQTAAAEAGSHSGRGGGGESHRASPTPSSHGLRSQASSRRESAAGEASIVAGDGPCSFSVGQTSAMNSLPHRQLPPRLLCCLQALHACRQRMAPASGTPPVAPPCKAPTTGQPGTLWLEVRAPAMQPLQQMGVPAL